MNIIMLGAPGAGKGTQAAVLCEHFGIPTISTGNMIREALKNGTEMGLKAKSFMAEALDNMGVEIQHVINIDISDEKIINRMSGRRVCENCGRPFHIVTLKPKKEGICDDCGGTLVQRKDDHPDTVLARLETYHKETEPLVSYYEKQGKLVTVKGQDDVEATTKAILEGIEA